MSIANIIHSLNTWAPLALQESYDNAGTQVGNIQQDCTGVLVALDITEAIIEEAIEKKCNLIVSHHPLIFKGLKSITGKDYIERCIIKALQNNIVIYSTHTNLDALDYGVNQEIAERMQLENTQILSPRPDSLLKLYTYVPLANKEEVLAALFEAGAGHIGEYSECAFQTEGTGSFKPSENANPTIGEAGGKREYVKEVKIEVIVPFYKSNAILQALKKAHPYEEVAYELIPLKNSQGNYGFGMTGQLKEAMSIEEFFNLLKEAFHLKVIKHTESNKIKEIKNVAICGGSGAFLINAAKASKADIYITGDLKYHEYFLAEEDIILADIGHFESEQFTINLICRYLRKKFSKFAVYSTELNTNPIKYFT